MTAAAETLTVRVPFAVRKRDGRKLVLVTPAWAGEPDVRSHSGHLHGGRNPCPLFQGKVSHNAP